VDQRDAIERVVWTVIAGALAAAVVVLADISAWWAPALLAAINYALVWVRAKASALPSPGEGLPGLPTGEA
jgi:hypothetical protein